MLCLKLFPIFTTDTKKEGEGAGGRRVRGAGGEDNRAGLLPRVGETEGPGRLLRCQGEKGLRHHEQTSGLYLCF